jgi:hypothetical protein
MTSRHRFERFAKRRDLPTQRMQEVTPNGPRWVYTSSVTESAWQAWEAQRRHFNGGGSDASR